jgi:alpha-glucosidase
MQLGVLTPFCRNHSEVGNVDQYAWSFGDVVRDHVRAAVELRYRLLPYNYSAFVRASETGEPVQRPLVLDHQYDSAVRDIDDQYLFGTDLLVSPVTAPGTTSRQVYLPAGDWHDWHTGEVVAGPAFVVAPTPMDRIPVHARGGAVVPMWPEAPPSTDGHHPEVVALHAFVPLADGSHTSTLVEDDGITCATSEGAHVRTTLTLTRTGDRITVDGSSSGDGYPEFRRRSFRLHVHGATPAEVTWGGRALAAGADGSYEIPVGAEDFTVSFRL